MNPNPDNSASLWLEDVRRLLRRLELHTSRSPVTREQVMLVRSLVEAMSAESGEMIDTFLFGRVRRPYWPLRSVIVYLASVSTGLSHNALSDILLMPPASVAIHKQMGEDSLADEAYEALARRVLARAGVRMRLPGE